ncbi:hypothetical protein HaLaN_13104 [Haematococcus lacustris]|uniref:Uncharacterized protein n=1 Tax=Haematococcus lacustris TaxID=44745 RepID=A0A699ZCL0_HAELA|nr:hypothetical protein HaLaN_13104 [Haematococcus lacustris]
MPRPSFVQAGWAPAAAAMLPAHPMTRAGSRCMEQMSSDTKVWNSSQVVQTASRLAQHQQRPWPWAASWWDAVVATAKTAVLGSTPRHNSSPVLPLMPWVRGMGQQADGPALLQQPAAVAEAD